MRAEPPWRIPEDFCNSLAVSQLRQNATSSLRARQTRGQGCQPCDTGSGRGALQDSLLQFVEQRLRSHEIGTRETFFEPGKNGREDLMCFLDAVRIPPQTTEAGRAAKLPGQGALPVSEIEPRQEKFFSRASGAGLGTEQPQLTLDS